MYSSNQILDLKRLRSLLEVEHLEAMTITHCLSHWKEILVMVVVIISLSVMTSLATWMLKKE